MIFSRRTFLWQSSIGLIGLQGGAGISPPTNPVRYVDVATVAGISFRHENAASAEKYLVETMGSGCAWLDFDQDGLLDCYLVNGTATRAFTPKLLQRSALYRNNGDGTFTDVTERAGVGAQGLFGMGVAVGDYDNDGFPDLFVLGYGRCILYHNNGDGTFTDVTSRAGVGNLGKWSSSGAWFDYNNDGLLDLIIANYVDWSPDNNYWCGDKEPGMRSYCHPDVYHPVVATLYHNNGDGTFSDVTKKTGLAAKAGNGLGIVTFDYDEDGFQDIFISNDAMPNSLFHNNGDGTFTEIAYATGVAVGSNGQFESGMGTDAADVFGHGRMDLFIGHLDQQLARVYENVGDGLFDDATFRSKLSYTTFHLSTFGARFIDYDNDGLRDLFLANGHVLDNIQRYRSDVTYAQPKMMFRNSGRGVLQDVSDQLGPDFRNPRVSRGAAVGDFDNDGDLDILVNNNGQPAQLLRNDGGNENHWIELFLIGTKSNRDAVGARVRVAVGDRVLCDQRKGGMSYQSAQDPRLHFGLGEHKEIESIQIQWPSGATTKLSHVKANQILAIKEGEGVIERPFPRIK